MPGLEPKTGRSQTPGEAGSQPRARMEGQRGLTMRPQHSAHLTCSPHRFRGQGPPCRRRGLGGARAPTADGPELGGAHHPFPHTFHCCGPGPGPSRRTKCSPCPSSLVGFRQVTGPGCGQWLSASPVVTVPCGHAELWS